MNKLINDLKHLVNPVNPVKKQTMTNQTHHHKLPILTFFVYFACPALALATADVFCGEKSKRSEDPDMYRESKRTQNVIPNPLAGEGPMDQSSSNENAKQTQFPHFQSKNELRKSSITKTKPICLLPAVSLSNRGYAF